MGGGGARWGVHITFDRETRKMDLKQGCSSLLEEELKKKTKQKRQMQTAEGSKQTADG